MTSNGTRVAVIAGCRTPFAKAATVYRDLSAVDLARICVRELVERVEAEPAWIDTVIMGQVIPSVRAPNLAREVVLGTACRPAIPAHTVNRACASANEAIAEVASAILQGHAEVGIGGRRGEPVRRPDPAQPAHDAHPHGGLAGARPGRAGWRPSRRCARATSTPETPAIAEPSTGLTMGQSAEKMAKENGITREEQDQIALPQPSQRRRGDGRRPAGRRDLPGAACRRSTSPRSRRTTSSAATPRWRRWPRCRPSSIASTAR